MAAVTRSNVVTNAAARLKYINGVKLLKAELQLELNLQRVLLDTTFGLPYWDWAADGQLSAAAQKTAPIWHSSAFGGQGNPVSTGPFTQTQFLVKVESNSSGSLVQTNYGLRRAFAVNGATTLPKRTNTAGALAQTSPLLSKGTVFTIRCHRC